MAADYFRVFILIYPMDEEKSSVVMLLWLLLFVDELAR